MRFIPAREDVNTPDPYRSGNTLQWETIENVPPGHVIVVDSRGDASAASGGDMLMTRAMVRGAAGFVTDGGLRDGHVLADCRSPPTRGRSRSLRGRRLTTLPMCRRRSAVPGWRCTPAMFWSATGTGWW